MRMAVKLLMIEAIRKKNERKREYRRGGGKQLSEMGLIVDPCAGTDWD